MFLDLCSAMHRNFVADDDGGVTKNSGGGEIEKSDGIVVGNYCGCVIQNCGVIDAFYENEKDVFAIHKEAGKERWA